MNGDLVCNFVVYVRI